MVRCGGSALGSDARLRLLLREYFPAALAALPNLASRTAVTVLSAAPTPEAAAALSEDQLRRLLAGIRPAPNRLGCAPRSPQVRCCASPPRSRP
ncbi:MAG: hypothetical protein GEV09_22590 [Pseudonocardiaceae bacterium]|nr:hypothetical protein [Pseudonocardiaceae bacterium]